MSIMMLLGFVLCGFISILLLLMLISKIIPCKLFCKYFGWHWEPREITCRGINYKGVCPVCGKEVMQDGQGNWF